MAPGLCFQSSDPIAPGWERGPNPWPRGHEFYNIEGPIEYKVLLHHDENTDKIATTESAFHSIG